MAEEKVSSEDAQLVEAEQNYNHMMARIKNNVWNHSKTGLMGVKAAMQMVSTKTGLYARIPIFCKGDDCPYVEGCVNWEEGMAVKGEACPVEVALLGEKLKQYANQFDLYDDNKSSPTDWALVEEIILMEINMRRCQALMSKEINPIQMMTVGVSENGDEIRQPQVSKVLEAYERFSKKRNADLNMMMATRKDNKRDDTLNNQESYMDIIDEAEQDPEFYNIEQRPDYIEGVDPPKE